MYPQGFRVFLSNKGEEVGRKQVRTIHLVWPGVVRMAGHLGNAVVTGAIHLICQDALYFALGSDS